MNYQIIEAFSPKIYMSKADSNLLAFCNKHGLGLNQNQSVSPLKLEGIDRAAFITDLNQYIKDSVFEFNKLANRIDLEQDKNFAFDLGPGPWVETLRQHDFTPLKRFGGMISGMIFIDYPEELTEIGKNSNTGSLMFTYGEENIWHVNQVNIQPEQGDIIIFPSYVRHQFMPIKTEHQFSYVGFSIYNIKKGE